MKIAFRKNTLRVDRLARVKTINGIIQEYQAAGYRLTLRQLYYQLVSRDVIPNKQREYANLSSLLTDARMCGLVDWNAIEDRLRRPEVPAAWDSPADALESLANQYEKPRQEGQKVYVEVWVEKDALSGVLSRVTEKYHVPILVNRGYSSASAMFEAYKRFKVHKGRGQRIRIIYLGDYDPSGIDMIRDVEDRIREFFQGDRVNFQVLPVALTRAQIDQYDPPENPAKVSDSRYNKFAAEHGESSWEVDALRPEDLDQILTDAIEELIDVDMYEAVVAEEEAEVEKLRSLTRYLNDDSEDES